MQTFWHLITALFLLILLTSCTVYTEAQRGWANTMYEAQGRPDLKQPAPTKKGK